MTENPRDLFHQADAMPYGAARVAALETVVRHADADPTDPLLPFEARLAQIYSYITAGERVKSFVPFAWCLAEYDRDRSTYGRFSHQLLWAFKWQVEGLARFPQVPLDRTLEVLDDMEQRYRSGGHSLFAVHQLRVGVARHVGDTEAAAEHYRHWEAARPDGLADCKGCWPTERVAYLVEAGRHADALRVAEPVLQGALTCNEQPQAILTSLLPALVARGRHEEAADAHRRAYRNHRGRRSDLGDIARHVIFLTRTHNEQHALELVERHVDWLDAPESPASAMWFAAAASAALSRLDPTLEVRRAGRPVTAAGLAADLATEARALAAQFDARNGTSKVGEVIEEVLDAPPWTDEPVPLSAAARRAQALRTRRESTAGPTTRVEAVPPGDDLVGTALLDHFDERWEARDEEGAAAAVKRFEATHPDESALAPAVRGRLLEARGLTRPHTREGLQLSIADWQEALPLLDEGGEALRVLRVRGRIGYGVAGSGDPAEGLLIGEDAQRRLMVEEPILRRRHSAALNLSAMLLAAGRLDEALQLLTELRGRDDLAIEATRAAVMHAEALDMSGDHEAAGVVLADAVAAADPTDLDSWIAAHWSRGRHLMAQRRPQEAVPDLTEAVAALAARGDSEAATQLDLAAAQLASGDVAGASASAEEALARALRTQQDNQVPRAHSLLIDVYEHAGDLEPAVAQCDALRALLPPADAGRDELAMHADLDEHQGEILDRLRREGDALPLFASAARAYESLDAPNDAVRALRQAAVSAIWSGQDEAAESFWGRVEALLPRLEDDLATFHRAGVLVNRGDQARRDGDNQRAIGHLGEAEQLFRRIGAEPNADDCLLRAVDLGAPVPIGQLEELHERQQPETELWFRSGYAVVDALEAAGKSRAARKLAGKLEKAAG